MHETLILQLLMKMSLILFELFGWNQRNRASSALLVKLARRRYGRLTRRVQMMQRDLGRAVEAGRHDADACAGGGIADHVVMLEAAIPHGARQDAIERDGNAAWQAHLAAMGVARQSRTLKSACAACR